MYVAYLAACRGAPQDDDPMDDDPAAALKRSIRRHRKSVFMTKDGHVPMKHKPRAPAPVTGSYQAQITKTTDGTAVGGVCFACLCAHALCNVL